MPEDNNNVEFDFDESTHNYSPAQTQSNESEIKKFNDMRLGLWRLPFKYEVNPSPPIFEVIQIWEISKR